MFGIALWSQFFFFFFFFCHQRKMDAKWNRSISEAKYNESWKSVLPPTLDPDSSAASNQTFNHFEMIISCRRRTLLQFFFFFFFLRSDELNVYRPTVASVALRGYFSFQRGLLSGRNVCANDVNLNLLTQRSVAFSGASMHCITHL